MSQNSGVGRACRALPIGLPDPVPKKEWKKRKIHGKADARALTEAELAARVLQAWEKAAKPAAARGCVYYADRYE